MWGDLESDPPDRYMDVFIGTWEELMDFGPEDIWLED
jgi:hypothetical protein